MKLLISLALSLLFLQPLLGMEGEGDKLSLISSTQSLGDKETEEFTEEQAKLLYETSNLSKRTSKGVKYPSIHSKQKTSKQHEDALDKLIKENEDIQTQITKLQGIYSDETIDKLHELNIRQAKIESEINAFKKIEEKVAAKKKKLIIEKAQASTQTDVEKKELLTEHSNILQPDEKINIIPLQQEASDESKLVAQSSGGTEEIKEILVQMPSQTIADQKQPEEITVKANEPVSTTSTENQTINIEQQKETEKKAKEEEKKILLAKNIGLTDAKIRKNKHRSIFWSILTVLGSAGTFFSWIYQLPRKATYTIGAVSILSGLKTTHSVYSWWAAHRELKKLRTEKRL
jgi:hypothetical protein